MSIGLHTGKVAMANLMMPGRREISVYGNAVNIAKRIQELPKSQPALLEAHFAGQRLGRPEIVLASADTLRTVQGGVFRAYCIGKDVALKGYLEEPRDIFLVRPAVPTHTSFIGLGSEVQRQKGFVFLDVGNRAETGIIDHHQQGIEGCAASITLEHPEWVEDCAGRRVDRDSRPRWARFRLLCRDLSGPRSSRRTFLQQWRSSPHSARILAGACSIFDFR